ncbi:MAG: FAD:protein FMN transferase [Bacillota bacterium]|nr:FAD:protein FMN transferase [Bacillota bacterium]
MQYSATTGKILMLIVLTLFIIIPQTGCGSQEPVSKTEFCLNTTCTITIYDMGSSDAEEIITDAFKEIRGYENLLSKTVEGSDIWNINHAGGQPVTVDPATTEVLQLGLEMARISGGKFDITIGRASDLWDFAGEDPHVPEQQALEEAIATVDYGNLIIDENSITLTDPDAAIDLGGIAKGYIADRTGEFLKEQGVERAIIDLGGNILALGDKSHKEEGQAWTIGIERPYSDRTELIGSIEVKDATVVTSGIYERKFEENGILYHHVLDPQTGYPAETDLESVTITAKRGNSAFCDGLSTVCLMLGREEALALVQRLQQEYPDMGLEAAFIDKNDDMVQTDGMKVRLTEDTENAEDTEKEE